MRPISLSLTPCFSWVEKRLRQREPFQRFPHAVETVETVPTSSGAPSTQLKQSVNEPCARKDRRKDFNQKHGVKKMKTDLFSHFLDLIFLTQGFFRGHLPIFLSLTPCFSWVKEWPRQREPFQRFPHAVETVETVPTSSGSTFTQLKQGVNERLLILLECCSVLWFRPRLGGLCQQ